MVAAVGASCFCAFSSSSDGEASATGLVESCSFEPSMLFSFPFITLSSLLAAWLAPQPMVGLRLYCAWVGKLVWLLLTQFPFFILEVGFNVWDCARLILMTRKRL